MGHDGQAAVCRDDGGVGGSKGFGADEVLSGPGQSVSAQRRNIGSDNWFEADIAGLCDQRRAETDLEVLHLRVPFAQVGEALREAGSRHDFQKDVGHSRLRHPRLNSAAQLQEALGFVEPVERAYDDLGFTRYDLEAQIAIGGSACGDTAIGLVEMAGQSIDLGGRIERAAERAGDHELGILPGFALEHAPTGIPVANAGLGEHVSSLDGQAPSIDDGEDIGLAIANLAVLAQDMMPPGVGQRGDRCIAHFGAGPVGRDPEIGDGGLDRLASGGGVDFDAAGDVAEQVSCAAPTGAELRVGFGIAGLGDGLDFFEGGFQSGPRQSFKQRVAPMVERQGIIGYHEEAQLPQQQGGIVEVAQASQPGLSIGRFGILDEVGQKGLGKLGGIVLRCGLQSVEQRCDCRGTTRLLQSGDRGRLADPRDAGKPLERGCGNALGWRRTQVEFPDCFEAVEMAQEFSWRPLGGDGAQGVECGESGVFALVEQPGDTHALSLAETGNQMTPKPGARTISDAADHALQNGDARQEHLVGDKPGGRTLDQRPGMIIPAPTEDIEPAGQAEARTGAVAKVREAEPATDQREMADSAPSLEVAVEGHSSLEAELIAHRRQNRFRDALGDAGKDSKETGAGEHRREAKPITCAAQIGDDLLVGAVQMEVSRKLVGQGIAIEAGEALALGLGEVTGWHSVRNFQHLREPNRPSKIKALRLAKSLRETAALSNMFCEWPGARP